MGEEDGLRRHAFEQAQVMPLSEEGRGYLGHYCSSFRSEGWISKPGPPAAATHPPRYYLYGWQVVDGYHSTPGHRST